MTTLTPGARASLPSLGAWIETFWQFRLGAGVWRRSLHWERGLKLLPFFNVTDGAIVAPFIGSVD